MMASKTNEQALEASIEKALVGYTSEEVAEGIAEPSVAYKEGRMYYWGDPNDFDKLYAIDTKRFWHFLETTQVEELEKLKRDPQYKLKIIQRLDKMVKKYGIIELLKKGLSVDDAHFDLMYVTPLPSSSDETKKRFRSNEFSITRQLRYSVDRPGEEIDMVIFINGLPIITLELKNPWTGQNARVHGQKQYRENRDTKQTLFHFARCIVHMAVDTDEVYMTTRLAGKKTLFLPFNKGNNNGKGNPVNPNGHKTAYLWEEILTKTSLANIIQHFVRLDGDRKDALSTRTLFFPRYHQLDVVRKLIKDASEHGVGRSYLIQHSAGSGKSNSITWTAYQLIETYPINERVPGSKGLHEPLFDSVIVVTDRRLLDKQLKENIKAFSEVKNIVAPAKSSKDLKTSLESGKRIIITTIQKFPFIMDGIADLSDRRFAVVIDEAHSSQSGLAHDSMNTALGEEESDAQDAIIEAMRRRKMKRNASYFAFTATPKPITLEKFGEKQEDGTFKPFHLYAMKQAIEEGFILDVLANYTTYKSYYEITKSIEENPLFDTKKAQKKLRTFVERDKQTIATKAEIMLEHFIDTVVKKKKLKGKAKGMVVTQSIESALLYYFAMNKKLKELGNPFKILIAFSGKKVLDGIEYTEEALNNLPKIDDRDREGEDKLSYHFDTNDAYRLLVVANKYLTGFDQPKLTAMYVDKKLQGVQAVQTLSRLNRAANSLGKKSEDLFVLDFFNTVEEIKKAFDPFYTATTLSGATDVNVLHELKEHLDSVGVYEWEEVEAFVTKYFSNAEASELSPIIDSAAERFNHALELEESEKADYKIKAKQFVKIYGQMASILPFEMVVWEKLFWFLKFLIPKLVVKDQEADLIDALLESVDLSTYGLERTKLGASIGLDESDAEVDPQNPNPRGVHDEAEKDPLDEIVQRFNDRWFQGWDTTPQEQRVRFLTLADKIKNHPDYQRKYVDNPDAQNRELAYQKIFDEVMQQQRRTELELYKKIAQDDAFKQAMQDTLKRVLLAG